MECETKPFASFPYEYEKYVSVFLLVGVFFRATIRMPFRMAGAHTVYIVRVYTLLMTYSCAHPVLLGVLEFE